MRDAPERLLRLSERLGALLLRNGLLLTTAESCTAGGIAYAVTQVPGSSAWFDRGFVTYSNESKQQVLGIAPVYLHDYGAVSEPVARAMALGALSHSAAHAAVAVTGVAGPGGGTLDKPVGTICLCWAIRRDLQAPPWARTQTVQLRGDRAAVRTQTIVAALEGLIDLLETPQDV